MDPKCDLILTPDTDAYTEWFKIEYKESSDILSILPPEGCEEEVIEGTVIKILTPNKLLARLPVLLVQIKAGNNS